MDSLLSLEGSSFHGSISYSSTTARYSKDSLVINQTLLNVDTDSASVSVDDLSKALLVKGQKIVEKLNELLKAKLPNGIESLKPEEVTPEATADRIVNGSVAFFDVFAKQNPNLQGEELLNKFMETVKGGIQQGYDDAFATLKDLGAFDFEGVQDGVEKTKQLIDEKLKAFEAQKRKELGLDDADPDTQISELASSQLLAQGGAHVPVQVIA